MENIRKSGNGIVGSGHGYTLIHAIVEHGAMERVDNENGDAKSIGEEPVDATYIDELTVKLILEKGMDIDAKTNRDGCTALHIASKLNKTPIVRCLLENGADVNAYDNEHQMTALGITICFSGGNEEIARLLVMGGVDVNRPARSGNEPASPLMLAVERGHRAIVKLMIAQGADIEARDSSGNTVLIRAAECGRLLEAQMLLEKAADYNAKNNIGVTALIAAVKNMSEEIVRLLLKGPVDIEARDDYGETALGVAASTGSETIVRDLLEGGADVEAFYSQGQTPQDLAFPKGHLTVAELLLTVRMQKRSWYRRLRADEMGRQLQTQFRATKNKTRKAAKEEPQSAKAAEKQEEGRQKGTSHAMPSKVLLKSFFGRTAKSSLRAEESQKILEEEMREAAPSEISTPL